MPQRSGYRKPQCRKTHGRYDRLWQAFLLSLAEQFSAIPVQPKEKTRSSCQAGKGKRWWVLQALCDRNLNGNLNGDLEGNLPDCAASLALSGREGRMEGANPLAFCLVFAYRGMRPWQKTGNTARLCQEPRLRCIRAAFRAFRGSCHFT